MRPANLSSDIFMMLSILRPCSWSCDIALAVTSSLVWLESIRETRTWKRFTYMLYIFRKNNCMELWTSGLLSISLFYNHYYYRYFTKISITLPLSLQFKNHTINYITIIIKTTLITITITLASVLHYITISTQWRSWGRAWGGLGPTINLAT